MTTEYKHLAPLRRLRAPSVGGSIMRESIRPERRRERKVSRNERRRSERWLAAENHAVQLGGSLGGPRVCLTLPIQGFLKVFEDVNQTMLCCAAVQSTCKLCHRSLVLSLAFIPGGRSTAFFEGPRSRGGGCAPKKHERKAFTVEVETKFKTRFVKFSGSFACRRYTDYHGNFLKGQVLKKLN